MNEDKVKKTLNYRYKQSELKEWIRDFSAHLKANPDKNEVVYPKSFATGFAKIYTIESGLTYRIVNYRLNADYVLTREPADNFFLIIYLYQYFDCGRLLVKINDKVIIDSTEKNYSALLMTNSFTTQLLEITEGTYTKGLTIQITEEWLKEKIAQPNTANYALFKEKNVFQTIINPKSQKLLSEIFDDNSDLATPGLFMNNRVLRLLEAFLENILKNGISGNTLPVSSKDVQNILKVESIILENYNSGFPSIEKLARIALMSETKLKSVFKKAFGMGMYKYYQKNRMHKAKELLCSGKYSVSEVGTMIGYQNLSNFSHAFKKEFDFLPKDFNKIG